MGIASLVLGILALVMGVPGFFAGPLSIVALVMGIVGIVLGGIGKHKSAKCATGGLVCSILGTIFSFIPAIIWFSVLAMATAA